MSSASPNIQDENLFKILVATDIHLGVHEKDPVRGNNFSQTKWFCLRQIFNAILLYALFYRQ